MRRRRAGAGAKPLTPERRLERQLREPRLGDPYALEGFEREFFDEALECDADGRRLYRRAELVIARKNRKTTSAAVLSLYMGSPAGRAPAFVGARSGSREAIGRLAMRLHLTVLDAALALLTVLL
jgi:hypothetical protein